MNCAPVGRQWREPKKKENPANLRPGFHPSHIPAATLFPNVASTSRKQSPSSPPWFRGCQFAAPFCLNGGLCIVRLGEMPADHDFNNRENWNAVYPRNLQSSPRGGLMTKTFLIAYGVVCVSG